MLANTSVITKLNLLLSLLVLGVGCGSRATLTRTHGRAYREAFAKQAVNPNAGGTAAKTGLDSHEAAAVVKSYRRGMEKGSSEGDGRMILMSPQPGLGGAYMPPPSVPSEGR